MSIGIKPAKAIVVLRDVGKQETKSGLYLPDTDGKSKPETGIVVAMGDEDPEMENGNGFMPISFKVGDQIVYRKYSDNKITVNAEEYNFINFRDVVAVVQNGKSKK